jgi:hypothetical protein
MLLFKNSTLIGLLLLLVIMAGLGCSSYDLSSDTNDNPAELPVADETGEETGHDYDQPGLAELDAEYYIDYEKGTIPISELPVGTRVMDLTWEWEFRQGVDYSDLDWEGNPTDPGAVKPVIWIIVATDHYSEAAQKVWRRGMEPHVTLLSAEELIGLYTFDNSTDRSLEDAEHGSNHWGDSGSSNATRGLRLWLNSDGFYSGTGFYAAFSDDFKKVVLYTPVPNRDWLNGEEYFTEDIVFIPSTTELGDNYHTDTYSIGYPFSYFVGSDDEVALKRQAWLGHWIYGWEYWTRSPVASSSSDVRMVNEFGEVGGEYFNYLNCTAAGVVDMNMTGAYGVRPAINIRADVFVTKTE